MNALGITEELAIGRWFESSIVHQAGDSANSTNPPVPPQGSSTSFKHTRKPKKRTGLGPETKGFIYFVQSIRGGPVKVGFSKDPKTRLEEFQCGSPIRLRLLATIPACFKDEPRIHSEIRGSRSHGEWFHPTWWLLDFMMKRLGALPADLITDTEWHPFVPQPKPEWKPRRGQIAYYTAKHGLEPDPAPQAQPAAPEPRPVPKGHRCRKCGERFQHLGAHFASCTWGHFEP